MKDKLVVVHIIGTEYMSAEVKDFLAFCNTFTVCLRKPNLSSNWVFTLEVTLVIFFPIK